MSGPSHGSPVGDSLWKANDHSTIAARSTTSRDVSSRASAYVSPDSRIRAGSECAVKTTCADRAAARRAARGGRRTRVGTPFPYEAGLHPAGDRLLEELTVLRDRERRPVRREHEPDERPVAAPERLLDGRADPRVPVPHAGEHGQAERSSSAARVCLGDRVERRRPARVVDPERAVAGDEVVEVLRANRAAPADVGVVLGDVREPVGDPYAIRITAGPVMPRPSPRFARGRGGRDG